MKVTKRNTLGMPLTTRRVHNELEDSDLIVGRASNSRFLNTPMYSGMFHMGADSRIALDLIRVIPHEAAAQKTSRKSLPFLKKVWARIHTKLNSLWT